MRYPTETDDNTTNFIITDNSSEIARTKIFPDNWIEPLTIIARVEGYKGIDEYVIHLIKDRLEMFTDTRDELYESFQKYMQDIIGPDNSNTSEEEGDQRET